MPLDGSTYNEIEEKPVTLTMADMVITRELVGDVPNHNAKAMAAIAAQFEKVFMTSLLYGFDPASPAPTKKQLDAVAAKVLRDARELISHPARWTKGVNSRSLPGYGFTAFCSVGAIGESLDKSNRHLEEIANHISMLLARAANLSGLPMFAIPKWNDAPGRTHAEVIAAFNRAIHLAEGGK